MRWLVLKDLQILKRSPLLVALLVIYPVAISLLIGVALSRGPEKPKVAIYSAVEPGESKISFGSDEIDTASYQRQFFDSIDAINTDSRAAALRAVSDGEALAAIMIPEDITRKLASGFEQPTVEVAYNGSDPVKAQFVEDTVRSQIARANLAISRKFTEIALGEVDLINRGGSIDVLGRTIEVLGLRRSLVIIDAARATLPPDSSQRAALGEVARFAELAIENLDISGRVLATISEPIKVKQIAIGGKRTPLNTFAIAVAAAISLMFISVLLAAGMLALEREEHAFSRLVRGLVSKTKLLAAKTLLAAVCALPVTLLLLLGVGLFVSLDLGRIGYWVVAISAGALAFASLGVALGALAREVRAASLLAFLLTLPLAFLALVPSGSVAGGLYDVIRLVSALFPFRPALDALGDALATGGMPWLTLLHLLALTAAFGIVARLALRRFTA